MTTRSLFLSCLTVACVACQPSTNTPGTGPDTGRTVVYRDTWGVPHIYAPSAEAGLYAMGWAQAEDRPERLLKNFLVALGESASVDGPEAVESDLRAHMWDHYGTARRNADRIPETIRDHIRAFAQGINDFYRQHPEDLPAWWGEREVDEFTVIAFGRMFLYGWSIGQAYGDLRRGGLEVGGPPDLRASNQWAVSPARSASGHALLLIDPHLSWWGVSRFWELRIHAGELHGSGVTLAGFPYVGLGHNESVAWAMTTGGPDTADIYELTLDPADPTRYRYDGEWREMTSREVTLKVEGEADQSHTLWFSHHGPVVARRGETAYAARIAYAEVVNAIEAWYELNVARDYTGAVKALDTRALFPQNVMVADTSGNIYYQRTGRVPIRPDGWDWTRPVDGSTSSTEWPGFHPASDHLQVLNPPQGYMQNCNIPPDAMIEESPFSPAKTKPSLYGSSPREQRGGWTNQRGGRAVTLLGSDDLVTVDEALAYAVDVRPHGVERWLALLGAALDEPGGRALDPSLRGPAEELVGWDGELRRDSKDALRYAYWRAQLAEELGEDATRTLSGAVDDWYAVVRGEEPPRLEPTPAQLEAARRAFAAAMEKIEENHDRPDAIYGDRFRVGRDHRSWPVGGGGDSKLGLRTLRSMGYGSERADHSQWGQRGQTSTQLVELGRPVRSWIYLPVGQSDRPDAPHYTDQAEKLFSHRRLKPSWWRPEDLAEHVASRRELSFPPE